MVSLVRRHAAVSAEILGAQGRSGEAGLKRRGGMWMELGKLI